MNDGQAFWDMLCRCAGLLETETHADWILGEINHEYFSGQLPTNKQSDYAREQNCEYSPRYQKTRGMTNANCEKVQFIHRQICSYLDQQGVAYTNLTDDEIKELASDGPDFNVARASCMTTTIAATKSNVATQFVELILQVAISPPKAHIIEKIPTLPHPTPEVISNLIKDLDPSQSSSENEDISDTGDSHVDEKSSGTIASDPSLPTANTVFRLEEELFKVTAQLKRRDGIIEGLKQEREALDVAYERLEENYEAVKRQSTENEDELKKLASAHNDRERWSPRELEDKISQQEETIRGQESQIKDYQSREADLRRRVDRFNDTESRLREKEDEFDIQKKELERQTKMANAGERYKQKVQASQVIEKERDSLRLQLEEARPKVKAYEDIRRHNTRLEKENQEIHRALSGSERDNSQLRETKQRVIAENDRLRHESTAMREALARNLEKVADLEEKSGGSEIQPSPMMVDNGLESELTESFKYEQQMQVADTLLWWARGLMKTRKNRISELERENSRLATAAGEEDSKAAALQRRLDDAEDSTLDQAQKEERLRQDVSSLESCIAEVRKGHPIEGSVSSSHNLVNLAHVFESTEIFRQLRAQAKEVQKKRGDLEERLETDSMSSFERHCMMTDLTSDLLEAEFVSKPKLEMIEEVKKQHSIALTKLQNEHDMLWKRYNRLQEETDKLWEERNQAWRLSYDTVVAKAQEDSENMAARNAHRQLTELIMKASKDTVESIKNSTTDVSQQNLQIINAKIAEGYTTQITGDRERMANHQQVDQQFFTSDGTLRTPVQSTPIQLPLKGIRKFFGLRDANKIQIPEDRGSSRYNQGSRSSSQAATF